LLCFLFFIHLIQVAQIARTTEGNPIPSPTPREIRSDVESPPPEWRVFTTILLLFVFEFEGGEPAVPDGVGAVVVVSSLGCTDGLGTGIEVAVCEGALGCDVEMAFSPI